MNSVSSCPYPMKMRSRTHATCLMRGSLRMRCQNVIGLDSLTTPRTAFLYLPMGQIVHP